MTSNVNYVTTNKLPQNEYRSINYIYKSIQKKWNDNVSRHLQTIKGT